jgi:predicted nucleic acid-binding protein
VQFQDGHWLYLCLRAFSIWISSFVFRLIFCWNTRKNSAKYDQEVAELVVSSLLMLPNVQHTTVYFDLRLIAPDADDDKFVNCVFAANADYLISDDRHFRLLLKIPFPKIVCLTYDEFKQMLLEN